MTAAAQASPLGYCQCGCGGKTGFYGHTNNRKGMVRGKPMRFLRSHQAKRPHAVWYGPPVLCACGCGNPTTIPNSSSIADGRTRGIPNRFIRGHACKGTRHPDWRGGRTESGLYVRVLQKEHTKAVNGYVSEHTFLVERAMGKPLLPPHEVHHVNHDRHDNGRGNLVACEDHAYHCLIDLRGRALKACGHPDWRRCRYCRRWDAPENLRINAYHVYHTPCRTEARRAES